MIHSQLSKRRIQMLRWLRRNLTKCESRTVDSEIIQIHWTIVRTQKNWWKQIEMSKPIFQTWMMNIQISKRKKILYGFDVACNHRWANETFIFYSKIMKIVLLLVCVILWLIAFHLWLMYIHAKYELFKAEFFAESLSVVLWAVIVALCIALFVFIFKIVS